MIAEIEVKSHDTFVVNEDAVVNYEGSNFIFVVYSANSFEMKNVETGVKENGIIEIRNGAAFKDAEVVTKNAYTLLMALKNKSEE